MTSFDTKSAAVSAKVWRYAQALTGVDPADAIPSATGDPETAEAAASGLLCTTDLLAEEVPVALEYNGISHATLLATPSNLDNLARGFSITEAIIRKPADIYDIDIVDGPLGITVKITIASACLDALKRRRRSLAGATGCGLCGLESLQDVERRIAPLPTDACRLSATSILRATRQLRKNQPLHQVTGATHAAGWADRHGNLIKVMEDVGRHNALDKLIGALQCTTPWQDDGGFLVMSSRASFEIIQKAAAAGMRAVVAVSAPTACAVRKAVQLNLFLAGFTRDTGFTIYARPEHLCRKEYEL